MEIMTDRGFPPRSSNAQNVTDRIIYEDDKMIVYHKPAGMLVQADRGFDTDAASELMTYRKEKGEPAQIHVINRLDRPVEGLVLFAKDSKMAAKLSTELTQKKVEKDYYAIVKGTLPEKKGILKDYLWKNSKENRTYVFSKDEYELIRQGRVMGKEPRILAKDIKEAILEYEVLSEKEGRSLVKIHLITGRHHQIRAQFANAHCPIYGDSKYGNTERGEFLALCSYHLNILDKDFVIQPKNPIYQEFGL